MSLEGTAEKTKCDHPQTDNADADALVSVRTLTIMLVSGIVGVLAGLAAGIPVGLAAGAAGAASRGVAVGLISGLAAAMVTGLSVAGGLHALVSNRR